MALQTKQICFVIMPFAEDFTPIFETAIHPAAESNSLNCLRADMMMDPGIITDQIQTGIHDSIVCVADLTGINRNVVYEVALAHSIGKTVILITQDDPDTLPFDLRQFRVFKYSSTSDGLFRLKETLSKSLSVAVRFPDSPVKHIENMLFPQSLKDGNSPFVIAASPLSWREAAKRGGGFKKLRRTCSDHLGIRGLIQAFGLVYGLERLPDLLNPGDYDDQVVLENSVNLYCIGSPKANRWTGVMLEDFFQQWRPRLEFKADPKSTDLRNIKVMLEKNGDPYKPHYFGAEDNDSFVRDCGILVRGPHPADLNCIFMVLAGRSALGTEAACIAATDSSCIAEIKSHLNIKNIDMTDHKQAFWALVSMDRDMAKHGSFEAILSSLKIAEVDAFQPMK
jgi:hypothetical protein